MEKEDDMPMKPMTPKAMTAANSGMAGGSFQGIGHM